MTRALIILFLASGLFLFLSGTAQAVEVHNDKYPLHNPYLATLSAALNQAGDTPYENLVLKPEPGRRSISFIRQGQKIHLSLYAQKKPAPLYFVMAGVGGDGSTGTAQMLAEEIYKMGFSAVTIPDPLSWQYIVAHSSDGLTGYGPKDAPEIFSLLMNVDHFLQHKRKLKIQGYGFVGYSFGALEGAFLHQWDLQHRHFHFQRVVLINPPVDVRYGISVLDGLYKEGTDFTERHKQNIYSTVVDIGEGAYYSLHPLEYLEAHRKALSVQDQKFAVGYSFYLSLQEVVSAERQLRQDSAGENITSFRDYLEKDVYPSLKTSMTLDQFSQSGSLAAVEDVLREDPRVFVMDNEDDFLLRPEDIRYLKSVLGERLALFDYGGHVGNLSTRKHQDILKAILTSADSIKP